MILSQQRPTKNDLVLNSEQLKALAQSKTKKRDTSSTSNGKQDKALESLRDQAMNISIGIMIDQQMEHNPLLQKQRNVKKTKNNMQMLSKKWHDQQSKMTNYEAYKKSTSSQKMSVALNGMQLESAEQHIKPIHYLKDKDRPLKLPELPVSSSVRNL